MKRTITVISICFWSAFYAFAQEEVEVVEEGRTLQFAAFGPDFFADLKFERGKEDVVELKFYPDRRSNRVRIPSSMRRVSVFKEELSEDGKRTVRVPQAEIDLSGLGPQALLIFSPNDDPSGLPYEVLTLDESDDVFGAGDVRFLNLTGIDLRARFGEAVVNLPPGISDTLDFAVQNFEPMPLRIEAMGPNDEYVLSYSSSASLDSNRGVLFVVKPPQSSGGRIVSVRRLW